MQALSDKALIENNFSMCLLTTRFQYFNAAKKKLNPLLSFKTMRNRRSSCSEDRNWVNILILQCWIQRTCSNVILTALLSISGQVQLNYTMLVTFWSRESILFPKECFQLQQRLQRCTPTNIIYSPEQHWKSHFLYIAERIFLKEIVENRRRKGVKVVVTMVE